MRRLFIQRPETVYTSLSHPALLFDWLITLTIFDNIIQEKSAKIKSGVYVDFDQMEAGRVLRSEGSLVVATMHRSPMSWLLHNVLLTVMPGYPQTGHDWYAPIRLHSPKSENSSNKKIAVCSKSGSPAKVGQTTGIGMNPQPKWDE